MKSIRVLFFATMLFVCAGIAFTQESQNTKANTENKITEEKKIMKDGLYGKFTINGNTILCELYYNKTPLTVTNFVGLATGKFDGKVEKEGKYYDGLAFHRVVPGFVVQSGDPKGNGTGGPGYKFPDEFSSSLRHNKKGILSMANSGPNTNGSQFFITLAPTPHLDNVHSVFGRVIEGENNLTAIKQGDTIKTLEIIAQGKTAQKFLDDITWDSFINLVEKSNEDIEQRQTKKLQDIISGLESNNAYTKTKEGIFYQYSKKGNGAAIKEGDAVTVHYDLVLYGTTKKIDSSFERKQPFSLVVGQHQVISGWEIILQYLKVGDKVDVVIPPELGYGSSAVGPIPPNSFLKFTIEVLEKK